MNYDLSHFLEILASILVFNDTDMKADLLKPIQILVVEMQFHSTRVRVLTTSAFIAVISVCE